MLKEVKRLADALGERRDPDVAIEELRGDRRGGRRRPRAALPDRELRGEQARGNEAVAGRARSACLDENLAERLAALAERARA